MIKKINLKEKKESFTHFCYVICSTITKNIFREFHISVDDNKENEIFGV